MGVRLRFFLIISNLLPAFAFGATADRDESLRQASVWRRPAWISEDFKFAKDFDVVAALPVSSKDLLLSKPEVRCEITQENIEREVGGMTRKFYCDVQKPGGGSRDVKFKYDFDSGEIPAEVLGTRLLWALGFPADKMFLVEKLKCRGCTEEPFTDRRIDPKSLKKPRVFELVAAESKFPGKEIKIIDGAGREREGWSFIELMNQLPKESSAREEQSIQREALRLLVVMLRYADNKPLNQRLVCEGTANEAGGCSGNTVIMLHDLGVSFGLGTISRGHLNRGDFDGWSEANVWSDPNGCVGELGENNVGQMEEPVIRERGRVFLARLLRGFSEGAEGRARVKNWFRYAHAELRGGSLDQWTDLFLRKVEEIEFPMGRAQAGFKCPRDFP